MGLGTFLLFALSAVMVVGLAAGVPQSARIAASEALDIQTARSAAAPYFRVALKTEGRGRTRSGPSHVFTTLSGYRALTRTGSIGGGGRIRVLSTLVILVLGFFCLLLHAGTILHQV